MVVLKENGCRICPKIFCCSDCRDVHESSKHPNSKCSLCVKQDLPYKPLLNKDLRKNSQFFCHIVFNHLPLHCKLCGDKYTNHQDLLTAQSCKWWSEEFRHKQREIKESSVSCSADNAEKKLLLTPVLLTSGDNSKSLQIADSSSILRLKQENFDSPPELVRHTSTPMHGLGVLGQKQLGAATIPQFVLKTPSSFDKHTFETTGSACSHVGSAEFDSRYYTGISSSIDEPLARLSLSNNNSNTNDNSSENQPEVDPSWNSPSCCPLSKNQLPSMSAEVGKDKKERVERSIMKPEVLDRVSRTSDSSRDSIGKRVRFSDQCSNIPRSTPSSANCSVQETPADNSVCLADSELFFEAQESLEEDNSGPCDGSQPSPSYPRKNQEPNESQNLPSPLSFTAPCNSENDNCSDYNNGFRVIHNNVNESGNDEKINDHVNPKIVVGTTSSTCHTGSQNNNNKNDSNNNEKKKFENSVDNNVEDNKTTTSSRVLMMFLVEQTDSKGLSSLDLRPLIDSGLKKLEKRVTSMNSSSHTDKGYHECSCKSTKFSTEVSSFSRKVNSAYIEDRGAQKVAGGNLKSSIKDNFASTVEKVERQGGALVPKQSKEALEEEQRQVAVKADSNVGSCMSDGIFSVVARVVRCALKKLPAVGSVTSRNLSREPMPQTVCSPVRITTTSSVSIASTEVLPMGPSCTTSTSASRILLQRSASKRPRDRLDFTEEYRHALPRDSSGNANPRSEVVSSPAAKRHRGWYRIRAREPIARMRKRQVVSPRGASLETQRFQQGSLTVGDTCLPLPSRAHQSTQTE